MKIAMFILTISISSIAFAHDYSLSFNDHIEPMKVVFDQEILLQDLTELHDGLQIDNERMIAGEFESKGTLNDKNTYLERLRSRLDGLKNLSRL